ncbi:MULTISPECIES: hypothetical protein [unclassified Bradyrhizobium]|uniref:hypothetical protein n=1 Tax=unclassified Bradyrhizobium TaxID=2631580 RepID=UPI001CD2B144|nr:MULTISPECIES: hypothetical protein [unclassified Bradyrhizobium]
MTSFAGSIAAVTFCARLERLHAENIDISEIDRCVALLDPKSERLSDAGGSQNAD